MIYFVQPVTGGPIKIGATVNVERRRLQLEARYGCSLVILATMEGDQDREREIHARFAHLRLGQTEQFQPAADLMDFIERPLLVNPNADTVQSIPMKTWAVRLEFDAADHERIEQAARKLRLGKTAFARMAVMDRVRIEEARIKE